MTKSFARTYCCLIALAAFGAVAGAQVAKAVTVSFESPTYAAGSVVVP